LQVNGIVNSKTSTFHSHKRLQNILFPLIKPSKEPFEESLKLCLRLGGKLLDRRPVNVPHLSVFCGNGDCVTHLKCFWLSLLESQKRLLQILYPNKISKEKPLK